MKDKLKIKQIEPGFLPIIIWIEQLKHNQKVAYLLGS